MCKVDAPLKGLANELLNNGRYTKFDTYQLVTDVKNFPDRLDDRIMHVYTK